MGKLLPQFKKSVIDDIVSSITANTATYYGFAGNPISYSGNTPAVTSDDFSSTFTNDWQMLFGKKLANTDILPIINKIFWTTNTVYTRYDNTLDLTNTSFYVVTEPAVSGGTYNIYKCIDNANGSPSTQIPDQIQASSFTKSDGYTWRYITSISNFDYGRLATDNFIPVYPNTTIQSSAYNYSGVEVVNIVNGGNGYNCWASGNVQGGNSTVVQIQSTASVSQNFYTNNAIYLYNSTIGSQLRNITNYIANSSGNFVYVDTPITTSNSQSTYYISPRVVFQTDGVADPQAYSVINSVGNTISSIVIVDTGYGISWANVTIQSNTSYGSGAKVYAIVPPAGGHGANPANELNVQGMGLSFNFANTESNTIPQTVTYNKIGIIKNPYEIDGNTGLKTATLYAGNTFTSFITANVSPSTTFTVGDQVTGAISGAVGTVAFSNGSVIYITGDKYFANGAGEMITNANGSVSANIVINTSNSTYDFRGSIYTKDIVPLYIQNINNVNRSSGRVESFKLIVQI